MKLHKNSRGFAVFEALFFVLLVAVLIGVAYYIGTKHSPKKNSTASTNLLTSQTTSRTSSANQNAGYFVIKEWGVRAKYSGNLTLEYAIQSNSGQEYAQFSSKELDATSSECSDGHDFGGVINRYKSTDLVYPSPDSNGESVQQFITDTGAVNKRIGDYYYIYVHPQGACNDNTDLSQQTIDAVTSVVQNLEAIPSN